MNDFMDLCLSRQSCRKFTDRPVEREKLARCVEAARQAPSACNSQPWSFVAVETQGEYTSGTTVVDIEGRLGHPANALVALGLDVEGFQQWVAEVLTLAP